MGVLGFICRWGGVSFTVFWTLLLFLVGMVYTGPSLPNDPFHPLFPVPYRTLCYSLSFFIVPMILISLYTFHKEEQRNRVGYWTKHPLIKQALLNEPIENVEKYPTTMTKEEMATTPMILLCPDCKMETTIRAHHCVVCDVCVLRRDHHCFVSSGCLGLGNQRFFINAALWCALGCSLFLLLHYPLHLKACERKWFPVLYSMPREEFKVFNESFQMFGMSVRGSPVTLSFCLSTLEPKHLVNTALVFISIVCLCISGAFAIWQTVLAFTGYTMFEFSSKKVKKVQEPDGETFMERIRLLFGKRWLLNMVFPNVWDDPVLTEKIAVNLVRPKRKAD